jgi:hypothetical protein
MSENDSKRPPVLAHIRFNERREEFRDLDLAATFDRIYRTNLWGSPDSVSGLGSAFDETRGLRAALIELLKSLNVRTLLDVPCGDFGWLGQDDLPVDHYIGADIVEDLVTRNTSLFGNDQRRFLKLDLTRDALPDADLLLCRDCLVHLSFEDIFRALKNIRAGKLKYFLTTTFTEHDRNEDIRTGDWRMLNFQRAPFNFGEPLAVIVEGCTEGDGAYADKSLGLWRVEDLTSFD